MRSKFLRHPSDGKEKGRGRRSQHEPPSDGGGGLEGHELFRSFASFLNLSPKAPLGRLQTTKNSGPKGRPCDKYYIKLTIPRPPGAIANCPDLVRGARGEPT